MLSLPDKQIIDLIEQLDAMILEAKKTLVLIEKLSDNKIVK